jgi:hypothetical protein
MGTLLSTLRACGCIKHSVLAYLVGISSRLYIPDISQDGQIRAHCSFCCLCTRRTGFMPFHGS